MSRLSVLDITTQISSTVNQEATPPLVGSAEYTLWLSYLNRSLDEWANSHDWEELRIILQTSTTGVSQATVTMPLNFRRIAAPPIVDGDRIEEVDDETVPYKLAEEAYFRVMGNPASRFSLVFNPVLSSGASIVVEYYSFPSYLASTTDVSQISDPQFLVDRTIAYIFESRSDARFQTAEVKSRERLVKMIEDANTRKYNSYAGSAPMQTTENRMNFRWGRD